MNCLLCKSKFVKLVETLSVKNITDEWWTKFNIDIEEEMKGCRDLDLYHCQDCDLQFFHPVLEGSGQLYAQLQATDYYYIPDKWEHSVAIKAIKSGSRILEVGCAQGDFVGRALKEKKADSYGIELNPAAVDAARQLGNPVEIRKLEELVSQQAGNFDFVCSFHVLEHVANPGKFIQDCIDLLKIDGQLILCVPNNHSFIRLEKNLILNQPPHHISRWSKRVFENLQKYFPLQLEKILFEPLPQYHLDWYANVQFNRIPRIKGLTGLSYRLIYKLAVPILRRTEGYKLLRGQGIYASYRKHQ
jgi:2-polyprenyl-3-methyl-5-hydroxy-6-metoxy-1,4-benzoquinol methylase